MLANERVLVRWSRSDNCTQGQHKGQPIKNAYRQVFVRGSVKQGDGCHDELTQIAAGNVSGSLRVAGAGASDQGQKANGQAGQTARAHDAAADRDGTVTTSSGCVTSLS